MKDIKILLVDDEEELVSTLVERLRYRNIDAEYLLNGAAAIQRMREKKFDVVLLDLKLPGISGIETMRVIKKEHPDIPIILITGHGSLINGEDMPKGAFDYLPKPVDLDILILKIREAVGAE
ncbi:MAG: response regulator [Candidatus Zixiibacteriota bacterium]